MQRIRLSRRRFLGALSGGLAWLAAGCSGPDEQRLGPAASRAPSATSASSSAQTGAQTGSTGRQFAGDVPTAAPGSPSATPDSNPLQDALPISATFVPAAPTPTPLSIGLDPALPGWLKQIAAAKRDSLVAAVKGQAVDGEADLTLTLDGLASTSGGPSDDELAINVDFVAVVSRRLLVRDVAFSDLQKLWNGDIADWGVLGSPDPYSVTRVILGGSAGPFPADKAATNVDTLDDLATLFIQDRGAIAIIPLAEVDFRFRTLNLDGVDFFRPGDAVNPLQVTLHLRADQALDEQTRKLFQAAIAGAGGPNPVSMTWLGDIVLARMVLQRMLDYGDWAAPFRSIAGETSWADLTIGNLECSISDNAPQPTDWSGFEFNGPSAVVQGLQLGQVDILSGANNHSFNFGPGAMQDTLDALDAAGILHFGSGPNLDVARQAVVVEKDGTTYAFLGYNGISGDVDGATADSAGTAPLLDWLVAEDIQREVAAGHVVIPYFHWGIEYTSVPTDDQRYFAQVAIDSGAAAVIGTHPHWVQAVETYNGKPIIYSLGNFVFDQEWSEETKQGMMAHLWLKGAKVLKIDLVPVYIQDYHKPRLMESWEAAPVLERVWDATDWLIENG